MATSSIFKTVILDTGEKTEEFIKAYEKSKLKTKGLIKANAQLDLYKIKNNGE